LKDLRDKITLYQSIVDDFDSMKQEVESKDKEIIRLKKVITKLEAEKYAQIKRSEYEQKNIAGDIMEDAKKIVEGETEMPHGHYRETVKTKSKFNFTHKKQVG